MRFAELLEGMKPEQVSGKETAGAVEALEKKLMAAKKQGTKFTYHVIDKMMQKICGEYNLTGQKLHDKFVDKHGLWPDNWIKKQKINETAQETNRAQAFIDQVYDQYPEWPYGQADRVMVWGSGEDQQFAAFKLKPGTGANTVEIDWIMAGPEQRKGVGSRAIQELQRQAQAAGIRLTLYPWSRGQISQASLTRLYRRNGFKPIAKGAKPMAWDPAQAVAEGSEQSLSSMVNQDQSERNEYKNFVKSQAGGDWSKGAKMYAQIKKRPSNDIFGDASRLNQFMKMKFDFDKFTDEDWDNYWLLAQHCDDNRNFQKNALSIIKKYQGTDHSHYKYLYDRISMGLTGKQKYGTQNTIKQGVAEGLSQNQGQVRQTLNAWMNQDQQFKDPTQRAGFQAKVWPYIQKNINSILSDKGADGKGSYPAAPYAAWLLVQHMDAYPQNQDKFASQLEQAGLNPTDGKDGEGKLQFLKDRYKVNKWIAANANNKEYFINNKPLPNPTVNVRNPAMFKDAGQVATSRDDALKNAIEAGNKLLVAAVNATDAQTQPSYKSNVAEGSENNNTTAQKIFFARSNKAPKEWSYDHVGFITQDGRQIQMSGHKGNDVYVTNDVTDDPEFPKQNIKIVSLSKPVSVPTTNSVGAENCGTFVANVLQANGIKGIDTEKIYSVFKQPQNQGVAENFADGRGPGRPGDSQRHGIPKGATMAQLEKASHAKGRKGQLARWQLNMRRGHKK